MMENGNPKKYTAMSKTVGFTTCIGVKLILDKTITKKGVFGPFEPEVYNPMYQEMLKIGMVKPYVKSTLVTIPKL